MKLLGIDDQLAPREEMEQFAKNLAIVVRKEATDPILSDIWKQMYSSWEAEVTMKQLEAIKLIVERNSLWLPPITVRYTTSYLDSL